MIDTFCLAEANYTILPLELFPFSKVMRDDIELAHRTQACPSYACHTLLIT